MEGVEELKKLAHPVNTPLVVSRQQNVLKPVNQLIALTVATTSDFCQSAIRADRIETNRGVLTKPSFHIFLLRTFTQHSIPLANSWVGTLDGKE